LTSLIDLNWRQNS